ncbi:MAG TPA: hypothetical protein VFX31_00810, partial [Ktedonobacterales bacterium]|nr:hypothetical protein [Ktedonobacterales bacterium]
MTDGPPTMREWQRYKRYKRYKRYNGESQHLWRRFSDNLLASDEAYVPAKVTIVPIVLRVII